MASLCYDLYFYVRHSRIRTPDRSIRSPNYFIPKTFQRTGKHSASLHYAGVGTIRFRGVSLA